MLDYECVTCGKQLTTTVFGVEMVLKNATRYDCGHSCCFECRHILNRKCTRCVNVVTKSQVELEAERMAREWDEMNTQN